MKFLFQLTLVVLFIFLSTAVFAQLDSVWYQGPSTGSVNSGAMQNTDNFTDEFIPEYTGENREIPSLLIPPDYYGEMPAIDESLIPEVVYIEDTGVSDNPDGNDGQTVLLNSFLGFNQTPATPPDPCMAAGPDHIIAMVNGFPSLFRIFDKQGNVLKTISVAAWWAPVSPDEIGDVQVIYDHFADRWVMAVMQVNNANLTAATLISYSDDSDPLGVWYVYRLDTKMHGSVPSNTWGDYPQLGFDDEAIYIYTSLTVFGSPYISNNKIRVIPKSQFYASNGGPVTWTDFWNIKTPGGSSGGPTLFYIHPTFCYTAGEGGYFFWANYQGWNSYYLYRVINPTSSAPTIRGKIIPGSYIQAPDANQLGGGQILSRGSGCYVAPIVKDGKLYMTHSVRNSMYPTNTSVRYVIVNLATNTIEEQAELGAQGYFFIYPTIAVDQDNNLAITFSRSADTEYIGAYYSTKHAADPPGLSPSQPFAEGLGSYTAGGSPSRWGDYMAIYLDPANNFDVWMHTEYAAGSNSWATYIAQIRMAPYSGVHTFASPINIDFGDAEVGGSSNTFSAIISNYGDADLIITAIPSSVGDFNVLSPPTLPYTIVPYDSLELQFNFTPSGVGLVSENFNFSSNDPGFGGLTFTGNGYRIYPAMDKTFYASSGSQNSGNILTIDENSGAGTNIGASLFDAVKSLAVHPKTGVLYGLVTGTTSSSDLIRVNAAAGDAYLLHTINIPTLYSMAFDTAGTLYVTTLNGEFYTVDLATGNTSFVVTAEGSYNGLAFHPVTNELWATTRSIVVNKDAVFKVDLSTGDTTLVGNTGLGKLTNAIAFDESSNLYGIIGAENDVADFISIDPSTGSGTIIGSVGFKSILGLAFSESGITGVEDDLNGTVPSEYALRQNYPNPFNPSTRINFVLPEKSFVDLRVYNILGKEVETLVLDEKTAGYHEVQFDAKDLPSGVYLYKLKAGKFSETKKMILVK